MKCEFCKKILIDDIDLVGKEPHRYTYAIDLEDHSCETCESHHKAKSVFGAFFADYNTKKSRSFTKTVSEYEVQHIKKYWLEKYTKDIDKTVYRSWYAKLTEYFDDLVKINIS